MITKKGLLKIQEDAKDRGYAAWAEADIKIDTDGVIRSYITAYAYRDGLSGMTARFIEGVASESDISSAVIDAIDDHQKRFEEIRAKFSA